MSDLTTNEFAIVMMAFRVIFGLVFALHGVGKIRGGIDGTAGWFDSIGMKPGKLHARAAAATEIGTGTLLAVGLLTPFAAAGMVAVMVVAGWTVHRKNGFMIVNDGWEYTFIVALMAILVAGLGPGELSIDHALGLADTLNGWVGLAIALSLGIAGGIGQLTVFFRSPQSED